MTTLYEGTVGEIYGRDDLGRLESDLAALDRDTLYEDLLAVPDLALTARGATRDGFKFTQQALRQVCGELGDGLFRLVADLSGAVRGPEAPVDEHSLSEAIKVYNCLIKRRFDSRLAAGFRVIKHLKRRTIDGLLSERDRPVSHAASLAMVAETLAASGRDAVIWEAHLQGRRMTLRVVDRKGLFRDARADVWRAGLWFCNDELGGETTIAAPVLCETSRGIFAIDAGGSVARGRGVRDPESIRAAVERAVAEGGPATTPAKARAVFRRLAGADLLGGDEPEDRAGAIRAATARLNRLDVPLESARRAVALALKPDASAEAPMPYVVRGGDDATWLDAFTALCVVAKGLDAHGRERLERAAWRLAFPD